MKTEAITQAAPPADMAASIFSSFSVRAKTQGSAKTEVNKIPVKKKPNSTIGPDFWVEKRPPSEEQFAAIIIGNGLNNMNGTKQ